MTPRKSSYDAVIVGAGPNGLAAGITLARQGLSVLLIEGRQTVGGGTRTLPLTAPGYLHDVCSAIHPLAVASPFFRSLDLARHGLQWIHPPLPLVHPKADGSPMVLGRDLTATAEGLGIDRAAWWGLFKPFSDRWQDLLDDALAPFGLPRHPFLMLRLGMRGIQPATRLWRHAFKTSRARTLFAGLAAHSILSLDEWLSSAIGIMLGVTAHGVGWPFPKGGAQSIADALKAEFESHGGEVITGWGITTLDELPSRRCTLLNVTPRQFLAMAGDGAGIRPAALKRWRGYRYGPAVYKVDYALKEPIPWKSQECRQTACLHLGANEEEIAHSEREMAGGRLSDRPFVLVAQPSLFDATRAPAGRQTAWAYCHVPHGFQATARDLIDAQIERYAPGFRDCIIAANELGPQALEHYNPNYVGGDINGGIQDIRQMWSRPVLQRSPYRTPLKGVYLCSSSTPPGGGVHGMSGYHAALACINDFFR